MKAFIYIDEEGKVGVSLNPPTATDLHSIGDGRLQVLQVLTDTTGNLTHTVISEIDEDGELFEPNRAEIHNEEGDDFHIVP